jgi:hypothetical protein
MRFIRLACLLPAFALLLGASGCGDDAEGGTGKCSGVAYPSAPAGAAVLHVASGCSDGAGDGSAGKPFSSISSAISAAKSRGGTSTAIVVAAGQYSESISVADVDGLSILGAETGAPAGIILQSPAPDGAVTVARSKNVVLRGFHIGDATTVGIRIHDSENVTVEGTIVERTRPNADGAFGYGIFVSASGIILQNNQVEGVASAGIILQNAGGIILQNQLRNNSGGGLAIAGNRGTDTVEVRKGTFEGNGAFGIYVLGANGIILQDNAISGTKAGADDVGDGIIVADGSIAGVVTPSNVHIEANTLEGNARAGLLLTGDVRGIILQNQVRGNKRAGAWIQDGAGASDPLRIEKNELVGNSFMGVVLRGATRGIILQNQVRDTVLATTIIHTATVELGDGISLFDGAEASVTDNTITGNGRAGLIGDAASSKSDVSGNSLSGNEYGIILQNQGSSPMVVDPSKNTMSANEGGDMTDLGKGATFTVAKDAMSLDEAPATITQ